MEFGSPAWIARMEQLARQFAADAEQNPYPKVDPKIELPADDAAEEAADEYAQVYYRDEE